MYTKIKSTISISGIIAVLFVGACGSQVDERTTGLSAKGDDDGVSCGEASLYAKTHDGCDAMDVAGEEQCFCHLGYYWDGQQCTALNGACKCVGSDCDRLSRSIEDCEQQHTTCSAPVVQQQQQQQQQPPPPQQQRISCGDTALFALQHDSCDAMDVAGEEQCFCHLGYYWDGQQCTALDGVCECVGPDCDSLSQSLEDCEAQHTTCS